MYSNVRSNSTQLTQTGRASNPHKSQFRPVRPNQTEIRTHLNILTLETQTWGTTSRAEREVALPKSKHFTNQTPLCQGIESTDVRRSATAVAVASTGTGAQSAATAAASGTGAQSTATAVASSGTSAQSTATAAASSGTGTQSTATVASSGTGAQGATTVAASSGTDAQSTATAAALSRPVGRS